MGVHDLPAFIDYILNLTGSKKMNYIGYSMGTTQIMCLLTTKPEYSNKLLDVCLMAPVTYLHKSTSSLQLLAPAGPYFEVISVLYFIGKNVI